MVENDKKDRKSISEKSNDFKFPEKLWDFAYIPDWGLQKIADLALPEHWYFGPSQDSPAYPILKDYLGYVYTRLKYEYEDLRYYNKIVFYEGQEKLGGKTVITKKCAFNTGLISRRGKDIYIVLVENNREDQPWYFKRAIDDDSSQEFLAFKGKLPEPADFSIGMSLSTYFFNKEVAAQNDDHILITHCERLPIRFLQQYFPKFFKSGGFTLKTKTDWDRFKEYIRNQPYEYNNARIKLKDAIEQAQRKARRYGDAWKVNIYRPSDKTVAFFLPLYLYEYRDDCDFEVGVIVNKDNVGGEYIVRTIYTTSMAYAKIRVMGDQRKHWLKPERIRYWKNPYKESDENPTVKTSQSKYKTEFTKKKEDNSVIGPVSKDTPKVEKPETKCSKSNDDERKKFVQVVGFSIKENFVDEDGTPGGVGDFYPITGDSVTIGRKSNSSTADIQIPSNRYMSRQHIEIFKSNGQYYVKWIGKTNPPIINGVKMNAESSVDLQNGDKIVLGQCVMSWIQKTLDADKSMSFDN